MVKASQIASFLRLPLYGPDIDVYRPVSLDKLVSGGVVFVREWTPEVKRKLEFVGNILAIIPNVTNLVKSGWTGTDIMPRCSCLPVQNPRLSFARVVSQFFCTNLINGIAETAIIDSTADIGDNVSIGHYSVIGPDVIIGDNTRILNHVSVNNAVINQGCLIKSHSVIGEDGCGFEYDERGHPFRIPHTGKVVFGDHVEIGSGTVICRGTVDDTRIGPWSKLDDHVFVAHNVQIGMDTLIIAMAEISGSVTIGNHVWIGPSVSIREHVTVGDGALVGIGANVLNDVGAGEVVVGNPAKFLKMRNV
jgi:UDP-3-O-[3-hydroxymyristoyl] glucosamine N-acyltransferase